MTKERKAGSAVLKIILLLVILTVITLSVLFALQSQSLLTLQWDQLNPVKLIEGFLEEKKGTEEASFFLGDLNILASEIYEDHLLLLTDSDIRLLDEKGDEIWYYTHEILQPVLQVNGPWILIYEKSGKSYMVIRNGSVLLKDILDEFISFAEITEKQILFITTNESGYKRTVHAVSQDNGIELSALYIDDYYPYYAKTMGTEETKFILYGLGMNSTHISTIIRLYKNTLETSPLGNVELEGLYPILYANDDRILFVGEKAAYCYNMEMDLLWSGEFEGAIVSAGLFENGGMIFALQGQENELLFFSGEGKEMENIKLENSIQGIETYKNKAAVITGSEAFFYTSNGNPEDRLSMAGMSIQAHFLNERKAFLVSEHFAILHQINSKNLK